MNILAIRHAQTDFNKKGLVMGQEIDSGLNETGRKQVEELIGLLENEKFTAIYSSPMKRCRETAEPIAKNFLLSIVWREELKERSVGKLAGLSYPELAERAGLDDPHSLNFDFKSFGGESSDKVRARIQKFLREVGRSHKKGGQILVITHSEIIRFLYDMHNKEVEQDTRNVCVHNVS